MSEFRTGERVQYLLGAGVYWDAEVVSTGNRKDNGRPYYVIRTLLKDGSYGGRRTVCGASIRRVES